MAASWEPEDREARRQASVRAALDRHARRIRMQASTSYPSMADQLDRLQPGWRPPPPDRYGPAVCDGCGRFYHRDYLRGPDSEKLCTACDEARMAPPEPDWSRAMSDCEGCRMYSFVTSEAGRLLCEWCAELERERAANRRRRLPSLMPVAAVLLITGVIVSGWPGTIIALSGLALALRA